MKFRKKPVVIEAWQVPNSAPDKATAPTWLVSAVEAEVVQPNFATRKLEIKTLEGVMTAEVGDWIIQGVKGELYPCKPDIFAATYDPA